MQNFWPTWPKMVHLWWWVEISVNYIHCVSVYDSCAHFRNVPRTENLNVFSRAAVFSSSERPGTREIKKSIAFFWNLKLKRLPTAHLFCLKNMMYEVRKIVRLFFQKYKWRKIKINFRLCVIFVEWFVEKMWK